MFFFAEWTLIWHVLQKEKEKYMQKISDFKNENENLLYRVKFDYIFFNILSV